MTAGAVTFSYRVRGEPGREAILFLHGFLGASDELDALTAELANRFYCLSPSLPGHGATRVASGLHGYRIEETAKALIDLLKALDLSPVGLVGYSMGGRLALYLATHFPDSFARVVSISATPGLKMASERHARILRDARLAASLEAEGLASFLARWYDQPLFATLRSHPIFPQVLDRRQRNDPAELARSLRQLGTGRQPSLWALLTSLPMPLLLLVGARDEKFVAINTEIAAQCPKARLETIPDCGHAVHLEAPVRVAELIGQFFGVPNHSSCTGTVALPHGQPLA